MAARDIVVTDGSSEGAGGGSSSDTSSSGSGGSGVPVGIIVGAVAGAAALVAAAGLTYYFLVARPRRAAARAEQLDRLEKASPGASSAEVSGCRRGLAVWPWGRALPARRYACLPHAQAATAP